LTIFIAKSPSLSHLKEREEKVCLNCGSDINGRFCHNCGQENVEPKESAWHLVTHFFSDLFHFDGKFFSTLKLLATKPGFLTEEYVKGRRVAYLNPIRMYLFVSAVFFLVLMSFVIKNNDTEAAKGTDAHAKDSAAAAKMNAGLKDISESLSDSTNEFSLIDTSKDLKISFDGKKSFLDYTIHEYDSMQKALPEKVRDNGLKRHFKRKLIVARAAWRENPKEMRHRFVAGFFHSLPYMLFISLPLIALLLKLLYIRRKQYYFVSHAIFTVNFYIFVFITLFLKFMVEKAGNIGEVIGLVLYWSIYLYLFIAMKRFYKQGGLKTFVKFILFGAIGSFIVGSLALAAALNSAISVATPH
jgi:hypothetical protein